MLIPFDELLEDEHHAWYEVWAYHKYTGAEASTSILAMGNWATIYGVTESNMLRRHKQWREHYPRKSQAWVIWQCLQEVERRRAIQHTIAARMRAAKSNSKGTTPWR
jgi:hypothetical protein